MIDNLPLRHFLGAFTELTGNLNFLNGQFLFHRDCSCWFFIHHPRSAHSSKQLPDKTKSLGDTFSRKRQVRRKARPRLFIHLLSIFQIQSAPFLPPGSWHLRCTRGTLSCPFYGARVRLRWSSALVTEIKYWPFAREKKERERNCLSLRNEGVRGFGHELCPRAAPRDVCHGARRREGRERETPRHTPVFFLRRSPVLFCLFPPIPHRHSLPTCSRGLAL